MRGSTYDGAMVQIYAMSACALTVSIYDNQQSSGWVIKSGVVSTTNPGTVAAFASLTTMAAQVDLSAAKSFSVSDEIYIGGATTQYKALHTNNYNSYAPTLTGTGASGTWSINVTGNAGGSSTSCTGNAATATTTDNINGRAFYNRDSGNGLGQDSYTNNGIGYVTGISLYSQTDGGMYASAYSTSWVHQIYGDFRTGQIAVRGKNNGTLQAWRRVLDETNASYAWNMNQNVRTTDTCSFAGLTVSNTINGSVTGNAGTATTATNSTQLGGVAASSYIRNDTDGTAGNIFSLVTVTKSLTVTTSWLDTGIAGTSDLANSGAYILTLNVDNYAAPASGGQYNETYTGIMYWYAGGTNATDYDEIPLHKSGHAPNGRYINLRTLRGLSGVLKLQIICNVATSGASNYIFKFRRMI